MKKARRTKRRSPGDLAPSYDFDYSKAKPNRFAKEFSGDVRMVALDPDVARVFRSANSVNKALRTMISRSGKATTRSRARRRSTS